MQQQQPGTCYAVTHSRINSLLISRLGLGLLRDIQIGLPAHVTS